MWKIVSVSVDLSCHPLPINRNAIHVKAQCPQAYFISGGQLVSHDLTWIRLSASLAYDLKTGLSIFHNDQAFRV